MRFEFLAVVGAAFLMLPSAALGATGWSEATNIEEGIHPTSVSCPTRYFCAAVDLNGRAVTYHDGTWSHPETVDSGEYAGFKLNSVSCPTSSFCVAVDRAGRAVTYDGGAWSQPEEIDEGRRLLSVSCPSASFCMTVDESGYVVIFKNGSWEPPAVPAGTYELRLVSCTSASFCMALNDGNHAFKYNGSSWSEPLETPYGGFATLSCASSSFCVAIGGTGFGASYNGTSWSLMGEVDPPEDGDSEEVQSVSCFSASFCAAVDEQGRILMYDGTSWSAPVWSDYYKHLTSVSCPSAQFCMAVDQIGYALDYEGGEWSESVGIDGKVAVTRGGEPDNAIQSISCSAATSCAAVDQWNAFNFDGASWSNPVVLNEETAAVSCPSATFCGAVTRRGLFFTYNGSAWTESMKVGGNALNSISCLSSAFCMVGGSGSAFLYNGSAWQRFGSIDTEPTGNGNTYYAFALGSVSCPTTTFCAAVDREGRALTYDGTAWSAPTAITGQFRSVSCATASFCVAVDKEGRAVTYDGSSWSKPVNVDTGQYTGVPIQAVSCPAASFCVAVDEYGQFVVLDGSAWSAPAYVDGYRYFTSISCPSISVCVAAAGGNVFTYTTGKVEESPPLKMDPPPPPSAKLRLGHIQLSGGVLRVPLSCVGDAGAQCSAGLVLRAVRSRHRGRARFLAARRLTLPAGNRATAVLSINSAGKRLLADRGSLPAKLTVTQVGGDSATRRLIFQPAGPN